jgi:predicted regulator of Ras-like GTPase activity (Roadblock/LC7/MglB family)
MPLLHWFRKKPSAEAEGQRSRAEKTSPEPVAVTPTTSENPGQAIVPDAPSIAQQSADIFVRPVAGPDETPVTLSVAHPLPVTAAAPPDQSAAQPLENPIQVQEPGSAEGGPWTEDAEKTVEPPGVKPQPADTAAGTDSDQTGRPERHPPPTVRGTTASGKINLPDLVIDEAKREIRLRLAPIISNFPPDLEQPSIRALSETKSEIVLPLDVIQSQLAHGRVAVSAAMFCRALPDDLKPCFETIEPTEEIPIPLREIFLRLPPEVLKLREDQVIDHPEATIQTPFRKQAEEDAERLSKVRDASPPLGPAPMPLMPAIPDKVDSEKLRAIFMTNEILDLSKTIRMVGELPGLRACLLITTDGRKLAGTLDDPGQEQAISALAPELFQQARSKLAKMQLGRLETITLYCGRDQLSTFIQGKFCLTVLHDNRPFKPGVREKVQAVISELATLSTFEKEP